MPHALDFSKALPRRRSFTNGLWPAPFLHNVPVPSQRDVENVAYEHRQRILREEERLRNYKTEVQQQLDGRQVRQRRRWQRAWVA